MKAELDRQLKALLDAQCDLEKFLSDQCDLEKFLSDQCDLEKFLSDHARCWGDDDNVQQYHLLISGVEKGQKLFWLGTRGPLHYGG